MLRKIIKKIFTVFIEKNVCESIPVQFKPMLFKGQLDIAFCKGLA